MQRRIRVCVIGAGRAGMVHARNIRWRVEDAELCAVVEASESRRREAMAELGLAPGQVWTTLEAALETVELDAVVITTPTPSHAELAITAAEQGKHVLCEKPMAGTLQECDRMIEGSERAGVVLQIGFMRRFDAAFSAAKREIEEGFIGDPILVRSLTRGPGLPPAWALDPRQSNGMLAEVNSHDFDTIRWLGGSHYRRLFAQGAAVKRPDLAAKHPGFYDTAVVTLELSNGVFGLLDGVCPAEYGYDARAEVVGTRGVLMIGDLRQAPVTRVTRETGVVAPRFSSWQERFEQAYVAEAAHFVDCIRRSEEPLVTGRDGRQALEAVLAANESIRTGHPVSLPFT